MLSRRAFAEGASVSKQGFFRLTLNGSIPAPIVTGGPTGSLSTFFLTPRRVDYNGVIYDLTTEGLYTFFNAGNLGAFDGGYRIVFSSDVPEMMRSLAWLTSYGRADEGLLSGQLHAKMKERPVALRCGKTSFEVVKPICDSMGVPCRIVRLLTAETPTEFDDGHVVTEVKIDGKWRLFDVPTDAAFRDPCTSEYLSLKEVHCAGVANVTTEKLAPSQAGPTDWASGQFATEAYYNAVLRYGYGGWRKRIYQIAGIDEGNKTYWKLPIGDNSRKSWVESLAPGVWFVLPPEEWDAKFYPA